MNHIFMTSMLLAGFFFALPASGQFPVFSPPSPWQLKGVLDQKPDATRVLEEVEIGVPGEKSRTLYVTQYRRLDGGYPWTLFRDVNIQRLDFVLRGSQQVVQRFLAAPPGSRLEGTFHYRAGARTLLADPSSFSIALAAPQPADSE